MSVTCYYYVIKTHLICIHRSVSHSTYLPCRPESELLKTDRAQRIMLRTGPVHARDNSPGVSDTESKRIARYRDLLSAWRT